MPVIKRKTRKAIAKQVKKLVNKHGPEVALGLATDLVGNVVEAVTGKKQGKAKKKGASGKKKDKSVKLSKSDDTKIVVTPKKVKKQAAKKKPATSEAQS
jgi:hypothetical protein